MISFLFNLILCANEEDYLFGSYSEFADKEVPLIKRYPTIRPGQKLYMNPSSGGISEAIKFTAKSESEAKAFFSKKLSPETEDYKSVIKKLKYPKFRTQFCTMSTYEVFRDRGELGPKYQGRYFQILTFFISCKREENNYNIVFVPFTVSLMAKTFLWCEYDPRYWGNLPEIKYADIISVSSPKTVLDNVFSYLDQGTKVLDSETRVMFSTLTIEKIFSRLSCFIEAEREKFVELPY